MNSKTDLLLVGGALTAQCAADAVAVGRALREVNSKRGGTKAKPPCQRLDEVGLAALTLSLSLSLTLTLTRSASPPEPQA